MRLSKTGGHQGCFVALLILLIVAPGCEKKPTPPKKVEVPNVPAGTATSGPSGTFAPLPEATRFSVDPSRFEKELSNLPDNPDVPKPNYPGFEGPIRREVGLVYAEALKSPNDAAKVGDLGLVFYRLGAASEAIHCFTRAMTLEPKSLRWKYYLGMAHELAFDLPQATATLKEAQAMDPYFAGIPLRLGDMLRETDTKAAKSYYEQALKLSPNDGRVYYGLAQCSLAEKNKTEAMEHLKRAVELAPKYADAQRAIAKLLDEQGEKKQGDVHRALADQGGIAPVVKDPYYIALLARLANPEPLLMLVRQLIDTSQQELAVDILQRALHWHSDVWALRQQLGIALYQLNRSQEAVQQLQIALDNDPSLPFIRIALARALLDLGRYEEAEKLFKQETERHSNDTEALANYAEFLLGVGRAADATENYGRLIRSKPGQPVNELNYVAALVCQKQYDRAAARFKFLQSSLRQGYDLTNALVSQLAILIVSQARPDPTKYRQITIDVTDMAKFADRLEDAGLGAEAQKTRDYVGTVAGNAVALAGSSEFRQAIVLIQKTISLDRGGVLRDAFRSALERMKQKEPATVEQLLKEYIQHCSESPDLANVTAWVLSTSPDSALRDGKTAVEIAIKACEQVKRSDAELLDTLAAAYAEAGRFEDAQRTAQEAVAKAQAVPAMSAAIEQYRKRLALYQANKPYRGEG